MGTDQSPWGNLGALLLAIHNYVAPSVTRPSLILTCRKNRHIVIKITIHISDQAQNILTTVISLLHEIASPPSALKGLLI